MADIIDGRGETSIGADSKRKFLRRVREQVREAVNRKIRDGNVTDIGEDGVDVVVRRDRLREPHFHHGRGGRRDMVHPGNREYVAGDRIKKPEGGQGGGKGKASDSGNGEDDFIFHLSPDEFFKVLFEDLGLPNMRRLNTVQSTETHRKRAGFTNSGQQFQMDRTHSVKKRLARVWASTAEFNRAIVGALTEQRDILTRYYEGEVPQPPATDFKTLKVECEDLKTQVDFLRPKVWDKVSAPDQARIIELDALIAEQDTAKSLVPAWNESTDLRFRNYPEVPTPQTRAVMFCLMDVSGSMTEERKDNAKLFFLLLYHFLQKEYDGRVELRFIRHHTEAAEVNQQDFFYSKETGGTIVSSALQMVDDIVQKDYVGKNCDVYMAQASDGDNWHGDTAKCRPILEKILGYARGSFYTEVTKDPPQELWEMYDEVRKQHSNRFWMGRIKERSDIVPIFRDFFRKTHSFEGGAPSRLSAAALQPMAV